MSTDSYSVEGLFQRLQQFTANNSPVPKPSTTAKKKRSAAKRPAQEKRRDSKPQKANSFRVSERDSEKKISNVLQAIRTEIRSALKQSGLNAIRSRFDTSDIVQDSMLQIWMELQDADMQHVEFTRGLLSVIAKGHAAKHFRRHSANKRSVANEASRHDTGKVSDKSLSPLGESEIREQIALLIEAMGFLHPARQIIVFRRFFDDLSYQEIGDELGRTKEWARQQCLKAQKELRILLMH